MTNATRRILCEEKKLSFDEDLAYQASFVDGVLQGKAEASAGVKGTIITVEDMFFNMPLRRQGISNKSEEYKRCLKIVSRYAVHYPHISFTCRKGATVKPDLKTSVRTDNQGIYMLNFRARVYMLNFRLSYRVF